MTFSGWSPNFTLTDTMNTLGTLTINDQAATVGFINGGTLNAYGNVLATNKEKKGSTTIYIIGTSDQTLAGASSAWCLISSLTKAAGSPTFLDQFY